MLSSLLCCCIYGHLENNRLVRIPSMHRRFLQGDLKRNELSSKKLHDSSQGGKSGKAEVALMMRVVDDFLYISSEVQVRMLSSSTSGD